MSKFFEIIRPDHNFEFVGRQKLFLGISGFIVVLSFLMLPINAFVIKSRGLPLNYSIDFRGGTEMQIQFSAPQESGTVRAALSAGGFKDSEVVKLNNAEHPNTYLVRFATVSPVSEEQAQKIEARMRSTLGNDAVRKFEFSDGGDKIYVRFTKTVETTQIVETLKAENVQNNTVQRFGRPEDNSYEIILVGLDTEVRRALESKMGEGAVAAIPAVESVGARAGKELRDDGIKALLAAIMFILAYIAVRFDFRYGPGTVAALLHDAILVMGAFAVTYTDFSLVTIAAILTVIGYSMNDTIVVFDRIRENAARLRDKKFDRVVNASINETLSRTILTSATVFFVTLAMNIWGTGSIREFGFAMNVGVVVGTYSSIFVAAPILIWLNDRFFKTTGKPAKQAG